MAKHTPGPWYSRNGSSPHFQGQIADETTGATVAISYSDEGGAHARLIAAAPELLAALERYVDGDVEKHDDLHRAARAAIAKATS
jgi:hypothetical protein